MIIICGVLLVIANIPCAEIFQFGIITGRVAWNYFQEWIFWFVLKETHKEGSHQPLNHLCFWNLNMSVLVIPLQLLRRCSPSLLGSGLRWILAGRLAWNHFQEWIFWFVPKDIPKECSYQPLPPMFLKSEHERVWPAIENGYTPPVVTKDGVQIY